MLRLVRPWRAGWRCGLLPLAAWGNRASSSSGLALAMRTSTALLNFNKTAQFHEQRYPSRQCLQLVLAGTALGLLSSEADCAPKKKSKTTPAAAKKAGPALSAIEQAMQPEKTFEVEKLIASRLVGGHKEYLVRWQGYESNFDTWEPMTNLSNLVQKIAAFDIAKEKTNEEHLRKLAEE